MTVEYKLLKGEPSAIPTCTKCGYFEPNFMRGMIQRSERLFGFLWNRPYCAVICNKCKNIIGWEYPPKHIPLSKLLNDFNPDEN